MSIRFTQQRCHTFLPAELAPNRSCRLWDDRSNGLGVFVKAQRNGKRRRYWIFRYTTRRPLFQDPAHAVPNTRHEISLGSLAAYPSLEWAEREIARLHAVIADGGNPAADRKAQRAGAMVSVSTLRGLAEMDLTHHFSVPFEKPESCKAAGESGSATRQRTAWVTHILPALGEKTRIADIKVHHINTMLKTLAEANSNNVAASVRSILSAAFNRAIKWELVPAGWTNPVPNSKTYQTKTSRDVVISRDQFYAAYDAALDLADTIDVASRYGLSHIRQTLAILVELETGRRPAEICGLLRRNINREEGIALLPTTKATKHTDERIESQVFALSERAIGYIDRAEALAGDSPFVFPANGDSGHIEKVQWAWNRIRAMAGIPEDVVLYSTRHRYISESARQGANVKVLSKQVGHHDTDMTFTYMRTDVDEMTDNANSVSQAMAEERKAKRSKQEKTGRTSRQNRKAKKAAA